MCSLCATNEVKSHTSRRFFELIIFLCVAVLRVRTLRLPTVEHVAGGFTSTSTCSRCHHFAAADYATLQLVHVRK